MLRGQIRAAGQQRGPLRPRAAADVRPVRSGRTIDRRPLACFTLPLSAFIFPVCHRSLLRAGGSNPSVIIAPGVSLAMLITEWLRGIGSPHRHG
jgi:hypothetical protein